MDNKIGFEYEIVDEADTVEDAARLEEYWFWQFKSWGFKLDNFFIRSFKKYKPSCIYLDAA